MTPSAMPSRGHRGAPADLRQGSQRRPRHDRLQGRCTHLWIADPNIPGDPRPADYDPASKTLSPYVGTDTFPILTYAAKSAIAPWPELAADWAQFEAGTIGNDIFPTVDFSVRTKPDDARSDEPLVSGYQTDAAGITIVFRSDVDGTIVTHISGPTRHRS